MSRGRVMDRMQYLMKLGSRPDQAHVWKRAQHPIVHSLRFGTPRDVPGLLEMLHQLIACINFYYPHAKTTIQQQKRFTTELLAWNCLARELWSVIVFLRNLQISFVRSVEVQPEACQEMDTLHHDQGFRAKPHNLLSRTIFSF